MALSLVLVACGGGKSKAQKSNDQENTKDRIEVLYFHGKQRCATCMAIEQRMKETLEEQFAGELKDGTLVSRVIDISQPEREALEPTHSRNIIKLQVVDNQALFRVHSKSKSF